MGILGKVTEKMKKKIVTIVRTPMGGIRKHIMSIVNELPRDCFCHYFISDLSGADSGFYESLDHETLPKNQIYDLQIKTNPHPSDLINFIKIFCIIKRLNVDIIHGHGAKGGLYARIIGKLLGKKVVYTAHGGSLHTMHGFAGNLIYKFIEYILYFFTDILIFESKYTQGQFQNRIIKSSKKFVLNYNGTKVHSRSELAQTSSHLNSPVKIGAFGQLRYIKGYDLIIKAISLLKKDDIYCTLDIYGEGEEFDNLSKLINDNDLVTACKIHKNSKNINQIMKGYSLIIQPSRFESFGLVTIESMALGIPTIVAKTGGLQEIIEHEVDGLLFESDNAESLALAIKKIVQNDELRINITINAIKKVQTKFDEKIMVENIKKIYDALMQIPAKR